LAQKVPRTVRELERGDEGLVFKARSKTWSNVEGVGSNAPRKIGAIHVILRQLGAPTSPLEVAIIKIFTLQTWG
jgi:hypothetical protein